ncbi:MAG: Rpn family recombination-promoting nuclease/putative transposase [Pedobacter sp.]|nr:MAG: Rpn family recombination-promoting nuclease/putative transposase [Pedobacter sp.]
MKTTTTRFIDPLTDFGFKLLFGSEPSKEILIAFLNALFEGEKVITDLEYRSTELAGKLQAEKKVFFDLYCTTKDNENLLVEMQRSKQKHFKDRCVFYMSRLVSTLSTRGESDWNTPMPEAYLISIMEFVFDDNHSNYIQNVKLVDTDRNEVFYKGMGYKFLILPNFVKEVTNSSPEIDQWFYLLKNLSRMDKIPHFLDKRVFKLIFKVAEMSKLTKEQRELYDSDLKAKSDYYGSISYAAQEAAEKAAKKAAKEAENDTLKIVAERMKKEGLPLEEIIKYTRLSEEEVKQLK